eukprot:TRINITY_DN24596_c0_g1_i1.p1 TRINITY_DN24596_c0_g1~~TRINITY_DN24596_c0_g1_i1.p1  ORF type:complete len:453 (-),score=61.01 TRINITY_DN24596_c0_g1_i1:160-1371(-)
MAGPLLLGEEVVDRDAAPHAENISKSITRNHLGARRFVRMLKRVIRRPAERPGRFSRTPWRKLVPRPLAAAAELERAAAVAEEAAARREVDAQAARLRKAYLQSLGVASRASAGRKSSARRGSSQTPPMSRQVTTELDGLVLDDDQESITWPSVAGEGPSLDEADCASCLNPGDGPLAQRDFRANFLQTLSYRKVWVPPSQRRPRHGTLILLDWDDTLICTSFILSQGYADVRRQPEVVARMRAIAAEAGRLLAVAQQLGRTIIVTNAGEGWVEYSASKHMPELLPALQGLKVISARHQKEQRFPEIGAWKREVFLELQRELGEEAVTNLIAIGDSEFEMDAAYAVEALCPRAVVKTIKFQQNPSTADLLLQLSLTAERLSKIVTAGSGMRISTARRRRTCLQ